MPDLNKIFLFRMVHIENLPHIHRYGITHPSSVYANENYIPIGDRSLIITRNNFILKNGRNLGDYIPFYFGYRTPMLYVVQKGFNMVSPTPAEDIVYCVTSIQKIIDNQIDFIFTDGHAVDSFSTQYAFPDLNDIDSLLDMNAVKAKYWNDETDLDCKRKKEAEFLVLGDIPLQAILGYLTYNEAAKNKLISFGFDESIVHVRPTYYF